MSLESAARRNMLKAVARRLYLEIRTIDSVRFRGPIHAMRLANVERRLGKIMRDLAEVDPVAAKLIAEGDRLGLKKVPT